MTLLLTLISGIAWTVVYIGLIRNGFKYKTYGMPLFALALNIAWEGIYTFNDIFVHPALNSVQTYVNLIWFALDVVIVITYFRYGKQFFAPKAKQYFIGFSVLAFAASLAIQLAFYFSFDPIPAAQYSAFLQNAAMSILFVNMLFMRPNTKGQSLTVAVAKWLGTLAPTLLMGLVQQVNPYILVTGAICTVFDLIYIYFIIQFKHDEASQAARS